jgi:hypothetical protein
MSKNSCAVVTEPLFMRCANSITATPRGIVPKPFVPLSLRVTLVT